MTVNGSPEPPTAVERERQRRRRRRWAVLLGLVVIAGVAAFVWYQRNVDRAINYADAEEHFKYGSIGSDNQLRGLPLAIIKVLPRAFPQYLPAGTPRDYTAFGFIQEPGRELPIGFSKRRYVIDLTGLNCSVCHTSTVRTAAQSQPVLYLGTSANTMNLEGFFQFLFDCAADERFTPEHLMPIIESQTDLSFIERYALRNRVIPLIRGGLLAQRDRLAYMFRDDRPRAGPGRVDTFGPYKAIQYRFPMEQLPERELIGTADYPPIWNQAMREGLALHWDGNNGSVHERNFSAAFGAGATPSTVDIEGLNRVAAWIRDLKPPVYPFPINREVAAAGQRIYQQQCYSCHGARDFGPGSRERRETQLGQVVPLSTIQTDPYRVWSFTPELAVHQATLMAGTEHRLKSFRTTNGYVNAPLDGLWLRAPYLHNGSVPTLYDLLEPAGERPRQFYRGYDVYDPINVGFVSNVPQEGSKKYFLFQTHTPDGRAIPGNSNQGHEYGTRLSEQEKRQLLEYLKTL